MNRSWMHTRSHVDGCVREGLAAAGADPREAQPRRLGSRHTYACVCAAPSGRGTRASHTQAARAEGRRPPSGAARTWPIRLASCFSFIASMNLAVPAGAPGGVGGPLV